MKLLTKLQKNEFFHMMMGKFTSIMQKNDTDLEATYVYCISSLKANSFGEYTKIFFSEIDPVKPNIEGGLSRRIVLTRIC